MKFAEIWSLRTSVSRTRRITLSAVFAAVYFVLRSIPTFQMIGVSGRFTAGDFMVTAIALIAGLWSGGLSVFIGTVIAYAVRPPVFFGLDFLPALVNVVLVGLVLSNHQPAACGVYISVLIAYLVSPYSLSFGYSCVPYAWLHILALVILLSPFTAIIPTWVARRDDRQIVAIALLSFVGTMAQHLTGGLLYELVAGYLGGISTSSFVQIWGQIFWAYPVERLVIVAVSTSVAVALLRSMHRANLGLLTSSTSTP